MNGPHLRRQMRSKWALIVLVTLQFGALTWLSTLGDIPVPLLWIGYGVAFGSYLCVIAMLRVKRLPLVFLFLIALSMRIPWVTAGLSLSDDAWRYLHDGRSQLAGVNPYRYAPSSPEALEYAGPEHPLINNADLPTIYPPAAQLAFRGAAHLGGTLFSWKILLLIADMGVGIGLAMLLVTRGRPPTLAAAYLLHPLPIIEFAGNGHLDVLGICAFVFSLVLLQKRPFASGVAVVVSAATKYLTFPLLPFYLRATGKKAGVVAIAIGVALAILYLPFLDYPPIGSLGTFARTFEFNGPLYLLVGLFAGQGATRMILGSVLLGALVWAWVKDYGVEDAAFLWIGCVLLVSPIVHPWYLTWLLPFLALRSEWWVLIWSGTIVAAYGVLTDWRAEGVWYLSPIAMFVEYLPVYVLLGLRMRKPTFSSLPDSTTVP